jgi:hypothetical protein
VYIYKLSFLSVIPAVRKPESSVFNASWMPDQVRHDRKGAFRDSLYLLGMDLPYAVHISLGC